jgi:[citrate (pro-3S)-lyase] ligase
MHKHDVIQYVGSDGSHVGILYYNRLLEYGEIADLLLKKIFYLNDTFWKEAREYFCVHPTDWVPVVNNHLQIQGFAYWDERNEFEVENALLSFEEDNGYIFLENKYSFLKQVCINDLNEIAYRIYQLLRKRNFPVVVIGKRWEWFSIKQLDDYDRYQVSETYFIYAEGTAAFRDQSEFGVLPEESASENFCFLVNLGYDNMNRLREEAIKNFMAQGIHVAKFTFPSYDQIDYITELEKQAHERGVTFSINSKNQNKKNITYQIFGKDIQKAMADNQDYFFRSEKKYSFIDNFQVYQTIERTGKRVYVVGPCIVSGFGVRTEDCLIAQLQKMLRNEYVVIAVPIDGLRKFGLYNKMSSLPIRKRDIVIFINEGIDANYCSEYNTNNQYVLSDIYNDKTRSTLFSDKPIHANDKGHYLCAKYIYDTYLQLKLTLLITEKDDSYIQKGEILNEEQRDLIDCYLKKIKVQMYTRKDVIGSIVMNGNPFTLGHQYLIEYAAKQVDFLYVFVVEENKSIFQFLDRFEMAVSGTKHLKNITVVPSGRFIISLQTLAVYFVKDENVDVEIDATQDLEIFSRYIALPLHITVRFVGEEPVDKITRQYNQQMKQILKMHSIKMVEIPRKEFYDGVISASKVRKYIELKKYDTIQEIVPRTTYDYLSKMGLVPERKMRSYAMETNKIFERLKKLLNEGKFMSIGKVSEQIDHNTSLINDLALDSIQIIELIIAIEREFDISCDAEELDLSMFDNIVDMVKFVEQKVSKSYEETEN